MKRSHTSIGWTMVIGLVIAFCCASLYFLSRHIQQRYMPSLPKAVETARQIACAYNMRQLGQGMLLYANRNGGQFPFRLDDVPLSDTVDSNVFVCPASSEGRTLRSPPHRPTTTLSLGMNASYIFVGDKLNTSAPPTSVLLYEPLSNHTGAFANFLFLDGHVDSFPGPRAKSMIDELQAGHNPPRSGMLVP